MRKMISSVLSSVSDPTPGLTGTPPGPHSCRVHPILNRTMIISSATDYREAARRRLPPFLFHYLDGGSGTESTLRANVDDLQ